MSHCARAKYLAGILKPLGVSSQQQLADIFTKPLGVACFKILVTQLGLVNLYEVSACGEVLEKKLFSNKELALKRKKKNMLNQKQFQRLNKKERKKRKKGWMRERFEGWNS